MLNCWQILQSCSKWCLLIILIYKLELKGRKILFLTTENIISFKAHSDIGDDVRMNLCFGLSSSVTF